MVKKRKKRKRRYISGIYESTKAGICSYRSSWELRYMEYLDANEEVINWSYEKLIIEYVSNKKTNKIRKYYPDFQIEYADGKKFVVEIKQSRKLKQMNVIKKIKAAIKWCTDHDMTYKILTEIELKDIGLL